MSNLKALRQRIATMGREVVDLSGIELKDADGMQKEVLAAFIFGMASVVYQKEALSAPEGHALTLHFLRDVLEYDPPTAAEVADTMIRTSIDASYHYTVHAIIHRGIDGHLAFEEGRRNDISKSIDFIFDYIRGMDGG